jgi:hypothetical protein
VLAAPTGQRDDEPACEDDWASLSSQAFPGQFKVWASCTGEYEDDLEEARELIESFWEPMTEFMGVEPRPDAGTELAGGDTAIDFYLLDPGEAVAERGLDAPGAGVLAYAAPQPSAESRGGVSSSSSVVMRREMLDNPQFVDTLSHEFFHVLQQARNWERRLQLGRPP